MRAGEFEHITLCSQLADWNDGSDEDENPEDAGDDLGFDCKVTISVEWIGPNCMRLREPCSITPFGPHGPMLNLGDVIEATPIDDGGYRYVRTVEKARVWSAVFPNVSERAMRAFETSPLAAELVEAGGMWEWAARNLTVQLPREGDVDDRPLRVRDLLVGIEQLLGSHGVRGRRS